MNKKISILDTSNSDAFLNMLKTVNAKKINPNALMLYSDKENFLSRILTGLECGVLCLQDDEVKGAVCAISNSLKERSIWTISLYYTESLEDDDRRMMQCLIDYLSKHQFYKITTTFPADDLEQQKTMIDMHFVPEGYFRGALGEERDLITYSLFFDRL